MKESSLYASCQLAASEVGSRLLRNNVGFYLKGKHAIRYGLGTGSSDFVGFQPITITADMVGQKIARFVACEIKVEGKEPSPEQHQFLTAVANAGGLAFWCASPEEVRARLKQG